MKHRRKHHRLGGVLVLVEAVAGLAILMVAHRTARPQRRLDGGIEKVSNKPPDGQTAADADHNRLQFEKSPYLLQYARPSAVPVTAPEPRKPLPASIRMQSTCCQKRETNVEWSNPSAQPSPQHGTDTKTPANRRQAAASGFFI